MSPAWISVWGSVSISYRSRTLRGTLIWSAPDLVSLTSLRPAQFPCRSVTRWWPSPLLFQLQQLPAGWTSCLLSHNPPVHFHSQPKAPPENRKARSLSSSSSRAFTQPCLPSIFMSHPSALACHDSSIQNYVTPRGAMRLCILSLTLVPALSSVFKDPPPHLCLI